VSCRHIVSRETSGFGKQAEEFFIMADSDEQILATLQSLLRLRRPGERLSGSLRTEFQHLLEKAEGLEDLVSRIATDLRKYEDEEVLAVLDMAISRLEDRLSPGLARCLRLATTHASLAATAAVNNAVNEAKVGQVAEKAVKGALSQQLAQLVDGAVWKSAPFTMGKWLLPIIVAAVLGGTILGVTQVRGLVDLAKDGRERIVQARDEAVKQVNKDLNEEIESQRKQLATLFANAQATLTSERVRRQKDLKEVAKTAQGEVKEHAQRVWTEAEKNGATAFQGRRDVVLAALSSKLAEAQQKIDGMLGALPKQIDAIALKMDDVKKVEPKLDLFIAERPAFEKLAKELSPFAPGERLGWVTVFYGWNVALWAVSLLLSATALVLSIRRGRPVGQP
jgi:hypothetical protein